MPAIDTDTEIEVKAAAVSVRSPQVRLAALCMVAFLMRLAFSIWLGLNVPPEPGSDSAEYDHYAWNLALGRGYRGPSPDVSDKDHLTAYRPPGPSLLWALLYKVLGHRYDVVRIIHCLLGASSVLLLWRIGSTLFGLRAGWVAAIGWTFWPTSLFYSAQLLSEPVASFALLWFVWSAIRFAEAPSWLLSLLAGALLGINLQIHPARVFLLPLIVIWAAWQFRGSLLYLVRALSIPCIAIMVLLPWVLRNYAEFGKPIAFSTAGGSALLQGNNRLIVTDPSLYGYSVWDTEIPEYRELLQAPNDEFKRDEVAKRLAVEWLLSHRDKWPFLIQAKFRRGWTPFLQPQSPRLYRLGTLLSWGPVVVLFTLAFVPTLVAYLKRGHPGWLIHLVVLHYVAIIIIFFGNSRYRYPIEPFCLLLAAAAIDFAWSLLRGMLQEPVGEQRATA